MVLLGIPNEQELHKWEEIIKPQANYHIFTEPDRNNEHTAIAINPTMPPKTFRNLHLLKI